MAISTLKPLRVLAMIGIGAVLAVLFYFIGIPQKITGVLTGMNGIVPGFFCLLGMRFITLVAVIVLCISKELIPRFLY